VVSLAAALLKEIQELLPPDSLSAMRPSDGEAAPGANPSSK